MMAGWRWPLPTSADTPQPTRFSQSQLWWEFEMICVVSVSGDQISFFYVVFNSSHQVAHSTVHRWPGCISVWDLRSEIRDIFMIWQNHPPPLWEFLLPTFIVDRAVGCRCAHNCHQIEAAWVGLWKQTTSPPVVTLVTPECTSHWLRAPKQSNDRFFLSSQKLECQDILFWMKGQKSGYFQTYVWKQVEIQSCIWNCDVGPAWRTKSKSPG